MDMFSSIFTSSLLTRTRAAEMSYQTSCSWNKEQLTRCVFLRPASSVLISFPATRPTELRAHASSTPPRICASKIPIPSRWPGEYHRRNCDLSVKGKKKTVVQ
jgi:hypothetical protein